MTIFLLEVISQSLCEDCVKEIRKMMGEGAYICVGGGGGGL